MEFKNNYWPKTTGYKAKTQTDKNLAWFLPRPKPDRYRGGMPLHCEEWLINLARDILQKEDIKLLNLFCGMNKYGMRVDIKEEVEPDIVADAHNFVDANNLKEEQFDVILADPPYSNEESKELYGTPDINYNKWTKQCDKVLKPGGLLIVYHKYIMPNPDPSKYRVEKRVFIGNRSRHLPRVAIYFRKNFNQKFEQ